MRDPDPRGADHLLRDLLVERPRGSVGARPGEGDAARFQHALDGSVLAFAAVEREKVHAGRLALERRHHRRKLRLPGGKEVALEGSLESGQLLARDSVDRPRRSEEPGLRLIEHRRDVLRGRDRYASLVAGPPEEDGDVGAGH